MNILIIGGTRFFGKDTVDAFLKNGENVTIGSRGLTEDGYGKLVDRIKMDVYDEESVRSALKGKEFDVVIDKMGYGSLDVKNILDNVCCNKFIHMSTAGVYNLNHYDIKEEEFNLSNQSLVWCTRGDRFGYDFEKRMSEVVLKEYYDDIEWITVRSPFVLGKADYTGRLFFYIDHILNKIPLYVDNLGDCFGVSYQREIGRFMADIAYTNYKGPINYCSKGVISVDEIIKITENICGMKAILDTDGDIAPYNGTKSNSLDIKKARKLGFEPQDIHDWIEDLIEYYICLIRNKK